MQSVIALLEQILRRGLSEKFHQLPFHGFIDCFPMHVGLFAPLVACSPPFAVECKGASVLHLHMITRVDFATTYAFCQSSNELRGQQLSESHKNPLHTTRKTPRREEEEPSPASGKKDVRRSIGASATRVRAN